MGWEDRTTFESIRKLFKFSPNEFVILMRRLLEPEAFKRWRSRVYNSGRLKNEKKREIKSTKFKSKTQNVDGITKRKK